jgi:hypothetical protein
MAVHRAHAPMAGTACRLSKDSDVSRFPGPPGNDVLAANESPMAIPPDSLQHPRHRIRTDLALPLGPITLSSAGAPRLSSPRQVGA